MTNKPKCKYCYDKGYASVLDGGQTIAPDFIGDKRWNEGMREYKKPCLKCTKGKKLAKTMQKDAKLCKPKCKPVEAPQDIIKDWEEEFDKKFLFPPTLDRHAEHCEKIVKEVIKVSKDFFRAKIQEARESAEHDKDVAWLEVCEKEVKKARTQLIKEIEGKKKDKPVGYSEEECEQIEAYNSVYNQAIDDIIKLLKT